jgi:hypothetical protein
VHVERVARQQRRQNPAQAWIARDRPEHLRKADFQGKVARHDVAGELVESIELRRPDHRVDLVNECRAGAHCERFADLRYRLIDLSLQEPVHLPHRPRGEHIAEHEVAVLRELGYERIRRDRMEHRHRE